MYHIVTHTDLNFAFKRALHFSTLAIKLFKKQQYKVILSHNR